MGGHSPDIAIRPGGPGDVSVLAQVYRRASWSNEGDRTLLCRHPELLQFDDTAVREGRTVVAAAGDLVVGFYSTSTHPPSVELEDLFVDPDWMGRGVGRTLIEDAIAATRRSGYTSIDVDANGHARRFYTVLGFVECGEVPLEYGTAFRMRLVCE
jgi:GNAT superfamily N-acetyltransferase